MYKDLGIHWASTIPAFLALTCVPFPFLLYRYGPAIRKRCKFAREAEEAMAEMSASRQQGTGGEMEMKEKEAQPEISGEGVAMDRRDVGDEERDAEKEEMRDVEKSNLMNKDRDVELGEV